MHRLIITVVGVSVPDTNPLLCLSMGSRFLAVTLIRSSALLTLAQNDCVWKRSQKRASQVCRKGMCGTQRTYDSVPKTYWRHIGTANTRDQSKKQKSFTVSLVSTSRRGTFENPGKSQQFAFSLHLHSLVVSCDSYIHFIISLFEGRLLCGRIAGLLLGTKPKNLESLMIQKVGIGSRPKTSQALIFRAVLYLVIGFSSSFRVFGFQTPNSISSRGGWVLEKQDCTMWIWNRPFSTWLFFTHALLCCFPFFDFRFSIVVFLSFE